MFDRFACICVPHIPNAILNGMARVEKPPIATQKMPSKKLPMFDP
jgi:hypothetical protein